MRILLNVLIGAALLTGCGQHATPSAVSDWSPPQNPNPGKILDEGQADASAGRPADALAKYVWFYQNALKYDPAESGVRVSFALSDWAELGETYPPALERLRAFRDEAAEKVRLGNDAILSFDDFVAINEYLKDDASTSDLFAWLDTSKPDTARGFFDRSQPRLLPALVKTKNYGLAGKYIDPNTSFNRILRLYRKLVDHANQRHDSEMKDFQDRDFVVETTTLIAILIIDDRKKDAQQIVDEVARESGLPDFKVEIQKALKGEIPSQVP